MILRTSPKKPSTLYDRILQGCFKFKSLTESNNSNAMFYNDIYYDKIYCISGSYLEIYPLMYSIKKIKVGFRGKVFYFYGKSNEAISVLFFWCIV